MLTRIAESIINAPDFRGKRRALRMLLKRLDGRPIRSRYGPVLTLRADDYTNQCAIIGMDHVDYDDVFREVVQLEPGMAFVDIGANAGLFSMVAGARVGAGGAVIAFEPSLRVFRDLVGNAVMNRLPSFFPFNVAVGSSVSLARFTTGDESHSGVGHLDEHGGTTVLQVRADDLHDMMAEILGARRVVVKIDVEGAEELVIGSMLSWLKQPQVEKVIAEIDPRYLARFGNSAPSLYAKMEGLGFVPRRGLEAAPHYNEIFERRAPT